MSKDFSPPKEAEEYRNTGEILRDLAAQVRFGSTRNKLVSLADDFDRLAAQSERQIHGGLDWSARPIDLGRWQADGRKPQV